MKRVIPLLAATAALVVLAACASWGTNTASRPLENTDWRLASLGGQPAVPDEGPNAAMLHFQADSGRVYGGGSCNRIGGSYTVSGDSLTFSHMFSTKMACADERLTAQEMAFLNAINETLRYSISGDTLTLLGDGGALARLVAAPAP